MADYPGALDCFVDESRVFIGQNSHRALVLHCTGSSNPDQTAQELGNYFNTTPLMTSVHYGIDRQGVLCQYVLEADGAGGNCCVEPGYDPFWDQFPGNKNLYTLSIEFENDVTNSLPLTAAQVAVGFPLVAYLVRKYSIPISNIKGHFTLEPIDRAECPGPQFPWPPLLAYLQGALMNVPIGWHYDPTTGTLTALNGHTAKLGNAQFILNALGGWDPKNVPLEEEHGIPGGSTVQRFRDCELAWNAAAGVHYAPLGAEYQALASQLTAAQAQITVLQKQLAAVPASVTQLASQAETVLSQLQQHVGLVSADITAAQTLLKNAAP